MTPIKAWKVTSPEYGVFWCSSVQWPAGTDFVPGKFETEPLALAAASALRDEGCPWTPEVAASMWRTANEPRGVAHGRMIGGLVL